MTIIDFVLELGTGNGNVFGVGDDYVITAVNMGCVVNFLFAHEETSNLGS